MSKLMMHRPLAFRPPLIRRRSTHRWSHFYISVASLAPVISEHPPARSAVIINHMPTCCQYTRWSCQPICVRTTCQPKCLHIRVELNRGSTFVVLADANAAPPPPASTPPSGILAPFSTTTTIQNFSHPIVAISTQGSIRVPNQIHTRTSR
jgi:hypothetical protein